MFVYLVEECELCRFSRTLRRTRVRHEIGWCEDEERRVMSFAEWTGLPHDLGGNEWVVGVGVGVGGWTGLTGFANEGIQGRSVGVCLCSD